MNKLILFLLLAFFLFSACGPSKKTLKKRQRVKVEASIGKKSTTKAKDKKVSKKLLLADGIVSTALSFRGTRYKYGGVTSKGMDCSGLIFTSFKTHNVPLQRTSFAMANQGVKISLKKVQKGDLLFFTTNKNKNRINHVGLVVSVDNSGIKFIHATTSRGVIISSLKEGYWNYAFKEVRRFL